MKEIVQQINEIQKSALASEPNYEYQLIFDRANSRQVLMEALEKAQKRLILVCPWLSEYGTDNFVIQKLEKLLKQDVFVEIGWGYSRDINEVKNKPGLLREKLKSYSTYYSALNELERLENKYQNFKMKLIGTHEKFIICDDCFAMLGSHNFLTSGTSSSEHEVGIKTNDIRLIKKLIERFDNAENLEKSWVKYFDFVETLEPMKH